MSQQFQQFIRTSDQAKNTQVFHLKMEVQKAINLFRIEKINKVPLTAAEKLSLKREKKNYNMEVRNKTSVFMKSRENLISLIVQHESPIWGNLILHV